MELQQEERVMLAGARETIEAHYAEAEFGSPHHITTHGTLYISVCSHGVKPEGAAIPPYPTPEDAIEAFLDIFPSVLVPHGGQILVWRKYPDLVEMAPLGEHNGGWSVYSRACTETPEHRVGFELRRLLQALWSPTGTSKIKAMDLGQNS